MKWNKEKVETQEKRGNKEEKTGSGKTNKRRPLRILLAVVLTAATVSSAFSGVGYIGGSSTMKELSSKNNVSEKGKLEESLEFQKLTDSYLQALELYLDIRRLGSGDGTFFTGGIEYMPFLQTGPDSDGEVVTLKQAARWKGHNYDYEGYLRNYINDFGKYSKNKVSIREKADQILSLKQAYFARGNWENSKLYYMVGAGKKYSSKAWKKDAAKEKDTPMSNRYEGQETLLPGLENSEREKETSLVKMTGLTQKIRLHSAYARWLEQEYPDYAKGWLMYQMALASENNFEGTAEDGTKYNSYYEDVMRDYRKAHCVTSLYDIDSSSKQTDTALVYIYDTGSDGGKAISLPENKKLYYNEGKADFTLKSFLQDSDAYLSDANDSDEYRVYDESLAEYTAKLKKTGTGIMKNARSVPWNVGQPLCSEAMAADMAQFLLYFGKGLEEFLQNSGFLYAAVADGKSVISKNNEWASYVTNLMRNAVDEKVSAYKYEYAVYDARGEVYKSNWFWESFHNSGDLKEFLQKLTQSRQNAYVVVGYPTLDVTSADKTKGMSSLYQSYQKAQKQYLQAKETAEQSVIVFVISLILMLAAFFGLAVTSQTAIGKKRWFHQIPSEVLAVAGGIAVFLLNGETYTLYHLENWKQELERMNLGRVSVTRVTDTIWIVVLALAVMAVLLGLIQRDCQKRLLEHSVLRWCVRKGRTGGKLAAVKGREFVQKYRNTKVFIRYGTVMILYAVLWLVMWIVRLGTNVITTDDYSAVVLVLENFIGLPLLCIAGEAVLFVAMRNGIADEQIQCGAAKIAQGDISYQIELPEKASKEQRELAETINHIRQGLEHAVEESLRSERMKTELITNVSHDIKTPLTSVINYVDLLKREHIENERVREYLDVLDRKSMRLKGLIEDLVEASKASSGTIELQITTLNYGELVSQTNGEFEEKFEEAGLTLVTDLPEEAVRFKGDGRRVFRILENLYGNAAKYALAGTRIYVKLSCAEDRLTGKNMAQFSIKNISRDQLNVDPGELMERFVRGDASRSSEGSGLGLYIANNLTERMGGRFDLRLDGDLFEVVVSFPVEE